MDIDRIRYFQVFSETGSLVKASAILHISQPALSKSLKLLERELGIKLLMPDGRGLKLTPAGETLRKETAPLLRQWLEIPSSLALKEARRAIRIGSFEVFTTHFLGRLKDFVDLEGLELYEYGPGRLEQAVSEGTVDVGVTYVPIPKLHVDFIEITKVRMGIFGLKKFTGVAPEELPFIAPLQPADGTPSKVIGLDGWPEHKHARTVKYRVTMMESAIELCRQGLGVAYLPRFVVALHNKCVAPEFRLAEHASPISQSDRAQSVFLVQHSNNHETKLSRQIARCLRTLS